MNPQELLFETLICAHRKRDAVQFLLPGPGWKRPPGFPRGELLRETKHGRVYRFPVKKVLAWLEKNRAPLGLCP